MTITYKQGRLSKAETRVCNTVKERNKFLSELTKSGKIILSIKD